MADPKYANLPGIAYDQADVYETTDLPESDQFMAYSEDESDSIEKLQITGMEAFNRFKGKHVSGEKVDFSDSITRKPRTGYNTLGYWEIPGIEKETPLQKYQRLQSEIKELFEEVNEIKEKAKDEDELKSVTDIISQVEKIENQLDSLKLEKCLGSDLISILSDPQGSRFKQLVSHIEQFKQSRLSDIKTSNVEKCEGINKEAESGTLKYQMMYFPEKAKMQETARIAQLEQRICQLENLIGTCDEKVAKFTQNLKTQGVVEAVQQLGAKAALMDANQLDSIENRLTALIHKMDNIVQKKSTTVQDSENERKIVELYDIMKKTESMSQVLPQTVNRMLALSSIHKQAAEFGKSLSQLEELQGKITNDLENNKTLLTGVQQSFAMNLETINNNIKSLDDRLNKISK